MSLLILQAALDSLICDCCHKYLSVTPIKFFPNRKIKCGRCVSQDDERSVVSMYNEVAKRSIFKCVNHYQGCRALLNTTEVLEHEATCESKEYACPVCNELIPSYVIYNHFTEKHEELVLKKTYFVIKQSKYTDRHFLYRYDNYLLFVYYSHDILPGKGLAEDLTKASINFSLIGHSNNVNVDIVLTFGKSMLEKKINCGFFPSYNDLELNLFLKDNILVVGFSLEVPTSNVSVLMAALATNKEDYSPRHLSIEQLSESLLSRYFETRDIYLDNDVKDKLSNLGILQNTTNSLYINFTKNDVKLSCIMCSLISFCRRDEASDDILFVKMFKKYYFICYFCRTIRNWSIIYSLSGYLENVSYYCKWKCGLHVSSNDLHQHENDCKNQIPQPCPVELCRRRCRSFEIEPHFKDHHPQLHTPVFYDFDNNQYLSLTPSVSPIKRVFVVSNLSIFMELVWNTSLWEITLTSKILNARPRMIILDSRGNFITFIKEKGSCKNMDKIQYLCYLSDPEKDKYEESIKTIG